MITSKGLEKLGFNKDTDFVLTDNSDGLVTIISEWNSASPQPTESEIEFHRDRLQGLQGNLQSPEINISQQMLTLGGFTSGSESDSGNNSSSSVRSYNSIIPNPDITLDSETGSTYLRNYNWSTPTRPNTPNPNPTPMQGVGLEPILQRDYFDTRNIT